MIKKIRNIIVKLYLFKYTVIINGKVFNIKRSLTTTTFWLFIFSIYLKSTNYIDNKGIIYLLLILLLSFSLYLKFIYFILFPYERRELDNEQKFYYDEQQKRTKGKRHNNKFLVSLSGKRYYNVVPFALNLLFILLSIFTLCIDN